MTADAMMRPETVIAREPTGPAEGAPDDRLREAIQSRDNGDNGLLRRFRLPPSLCELRRTRSLVELRRTSRLPALVVLAKAGTHNHKCLLMRSL